jgi:2-aminoadipate transaminase
MTTTPKFTFDHLYSARSEAAPVRKVQHAEYDFAVAYPAPETLPMYGLIQALQAKVDSDAEQVAREMAYYPHTLGSPELREYTSEKLKQDRNIDVDADGIVLTAGSGESIALLIQAITNPGDVVLTEQFVYGGTLNQLRKFGADVVGAPIDEHGLVPQDLEETIKKLTADGRKPKWLYTIPEHQNPTGSTLSASRRREILEIAHRHGMPIMEDDCYVDLRFEGEGQPSFRAMDDSGIVMYVASFSKLIAPGLRMGYFVASPELTERALSFKHGSGPNQFAAYAITGFLKENLDKHRYDFNPILKSKKDAMTRGLEDHFASSGATWSNPQGGCYAWLTMPGGKDISSIRDEVFAGGVGYLQGPNFAPNGDGQNMARLCFAFETPEKNYDGIALLAQLFRKHGVM